MSKRAPHHKAKQVESSEEDELSDDSTMSMEQDPPPKLHSNKASSSKKQYASVGSSLNSTTHSDASDEEVDELADTDEASGF